jgi:GGDEF domain-containing protein
LKIAQVWIKAHREYINVSVTFDSLALLVTDKNKLGTLLPIPSFFSNMMRSQARVDSLTQFLGAGTEARVYNISQISELLPDAFSQNHVLTIRVVCSRHFDSVNKGTSSDNTKL